MFRAHFSNCTTLSLPMPGNGCGHTVLGAKSGTLTSLNYPGTYPNHTQCDWKVQVPQGNTLRLYFGDFNLEESENCQGGSLSIADNKGVLLLGKSS